MRSTYARRSVSRFAKDAGSPLILIVMQDPGVVCPCDGCCFKLHWFVRKKKAGIPHDRRAHGGRRR